MILDFPFPHHSHVFADTETVYNTPDQILQNPESERQLKKIQS